MQAVLTAGGQRIETSNVVNACGAWANEVASMVGVQNLEATRCDVYYYYTVYIYIVFF